jgi:ankyrin repeat protein
MDLIQLLLDEGANVDSLSIFGTTPFAVAIQKGNTELARLLEEKGALRQIKEKSRFKAALNAASKVGNVAVVRSLLQIGADVDAKDLGHGLMVATKADQEEVAVILIDAGADVNVHSWPPGPGPPLIEALKRRNPVLVRRLLNLDVHIRYNRGLALRLATEWGDYSIIEDLIFAGADVNGIGDEAPLAIAIRKNDAVLIQLLLAAGADVNNPSARRTGRTALKAAVTNGGIDVVRSLFVEGADPDDSGALLEAIS